jgi:phosphoribosylamine--glycine ligase
VVAQTPAEAEHAVRDMLEGGKFGDGGRQVLIEDCLVGEETSILVVVSGRDYVILPTSQDHKRIGDGDTGPNTGGMGAYSPAEVVTPALHDEIERTIVRPSVDAIAAESIDFCGTLFIGIMLTQSGPKVLEFNTRFGDPETQAVLPRLESDLLELLWAAACRKLGSFVLSVFPHYSICVVVSAKGYPGAYPMGDPITLPAHLEHGVEILHAGTGRDPSGRLVTAGGRVLGVTAVASTLGGAARKAYEACAAIRCASKYYRTDIGARQLRRT